MLHPAPQTFVYRLPPPNFKFLEITLIITYTGALKVETGYSLINLLKPKNLAINIA